MESEITLKDYLLDLRRQINEAFDLLEEEEGLSPDSSDLIYATLDTILEELDYALQEFTEG